MAKEFPLSPLEITLAVNRGITLVEQHKLAFPSKIIPRWEDKQKAVFSLFESVHTALFFDSHGYDSELSPGVKQSEIALRYRTFDRIIDLLYDKKGNLHPPAWSQEKLQHILAETYHDLITLLPTSYGNHLTANVFVSLLADTLTGKKQTLNFSQLDPESEVGILARQGSSVKELEPVFAKALTPVAYCHIVSSSQEKEWQPITDGCFTFLHVPSEIYHKVTGNFGDGEQDYLLAFDGGLIPLAQIQEHLSTHKMLDNFQIQRTKIKYYLNETWRERETLDGIPLGSKVSLFRVDKDHLTGLTKDELAILTNFIDIAKGFSPSLQKQCRCLTDIPANIGLLRALLPDPPANELLEKAYSRLQYTGPALQATADRLLSAATPVQFPTYYVTLGGSGAGKGTLVTRAMTEQRGNAIIISLDDGRTNFEVWQYGCGHGKDYPHLQNAATILREKLMEGAFASKKSMVRDCSGVPYDREKKLLQTASDHGYQTVVYGTTAPIPTALQRSYLRLYQENGTLRSDGRGLPPSIVVRKHIEASREFMRFSGDKDIDRLVLYDNSKSREESFLLATCKDLSHEVVWELKAAKKENRLITVLEKYGLLPNVEDKGKGREIIADNVNFLITAEQSGYMRVLLIYDEAQFTAFLGKAQLNKEATTLTELYENRLPHYPKGFEELAQYHTTAKTATHRIKSYKEALLNTRLEDTENKLSGKHSARLQKNSQKEFALTI